MGFSVGHDSLPEPLLWRRRVPEWLDAPQAACWLLLAGPGSGKTCSLELMVDLLAKPAVWLTCRADSGHDRADSALSLSGSGLGLAGSGLGLAEWLGLSADAMPKAVVEALAGTLTSRHPDGFSLVWDAVERSFDQPAAVAILELWLKRAPPGCRTLVASRFPLPFPISRQVIQGRIKRLGPADLWLSNEEIDDWLGRGRRHPSLEQSLAGWPLGIASLANLGMQPEPDGLITGLVQEEWLCHLPPQWRGWVAALRSLPALSTESIARLLPDADPVPVFEYLSAWGLLVGPGPIRPWHPLVRRQFQGFKLKLPIEESLLEWLCDHEPETAIAYYLDQNEVSLAVRLMRRRGLHLLGEGTGQWLARFPAEARHGSLDLTAMEGAHLIAKGELSEALARLREALDRLRPASTPNQIFAALLELLHGYWMKQDFAAFRQIEEEAEALSLEVDLADRIRYWNLKAIFRFDSGAEEEAERLTRKILEAPHFGQPAIAFIQQLAALNLGVRGVSRGRPEAAGRQFFRAVGLAREYPLRPGVFFGARLYLATCQLDLGRFEQGERLLRELESEPFPEEDQHRKSVFQSLMGHCQVVLGNFARAEGYFEGALNTLTACGLEASYEEASVLNELAVLHRHRGELSLATNRHEQALGMAKPWPHLAVTLLLQYANTLVQANEPEQARAALKQVSDLLVLHPAPNTQAAGELIAAVVAWRWNDRPFAEGELTRALNTVLEGGYHHLIIGDAELSLDLWSMLMQTGRLELLGELESRFPEFAALARSKLSEPPAPSTALPDLEIRCFGTLEVFVRGRRIEAWPRKRAKALLAFLLTAPRGLGREEIFERLFPELDDADLETRLNLLTSSLRRLLEPDLESRKKSRYLQNVDKRLRLETKGVRVDYLEFEEAYKAGMQAFEAGHADEAVQAFGNAIGLYTGDLFCEPVLMEGFDLERHRCRLRVCRMLEIAADRAFERGSYEQAKTLSERILEIQPTHEEAHRQLMRIYQLFGQEDLLRRQYQLCARLLRQELDLEPSAETKRLGQPLAP